MFKGLENSIKSECCSTHLKSGIVPIFMHEAVLKLHIRFQVMVYNIKKLVMVWIVVGSLCHANVEADQIGSVLCLTGMIVQPGRAFQYLFQLP